MDPIPKSEYNYANKIARISLQALEEVMGKNGLNAILNLARLKTLVNSYPPNNFDRQFSFEEVGAIQQALEDMYGPRGARGLALRAGRATCRKGGANGRQGVEVGYEVEGAIRAAKWVVGKKPGLYDMQDVLGLK